MSKYIYIYLTIYLSIPINLGLDPHPLERVVVNLERSLEQMKAVSTMDLYV